MPAKNAVRRSVAKGESEKKTHTACYSDSEGNNLFVPTVNMWKLHAASTPAQILKRSNLSHHQWGNWKRDLGEDHWCFDWLYHKSDPPENIILVYPSTRKNLKRGPRDGEFFVDEAMVEFRGESTPAAIATAANFTKGFPKSLERYTHLSLFEDWLLRGGDRPADWSIATKDEILKCQAAWNYQVFLRHLKISAGRYISWVRELFPKDQLRTWLGWLYGGPDPEGWLIISENLYELRERLSVASISKSAGVDIGTYYHWLSDDLMAKSLHDAIEAAEQNKSGKPKPPRDSKAWDSLFAVPVKSHKKREEMRQRMLRWADASTLRAGQKDLLIKKATWQSIRQKARGIGGQALLLALEQYVSGKGTKSVGVIAPGLFAPPDGMLKFRELASKEMANQRICQVRRRLPGEGFAQWMLDCILPDSQQRFHLEAPQVQSSAIPLEATEERQAESDPAKARNNGKSTPATPGRKGKPQRNAVFLEWYEDENSPTYHSPAAIRDRWNNENPDDLINLNTEDRGLSTVKKAIQQARRQQGKK